MERNKKEMKKRLCIEVKSGSGVMSYDNSHKTVSKGSRLVLYVPVVEVESNGSVRLDRQEGFLLDRETFVDVIENAGLLRSNKVSTQGTLELAIQTFYNRKLNKPHGKGYERLIDLLYTSCIYTLEEFLESNPEIVKVNKFGSDNINYYKETDSGKFGKALECSCSGNETVKKANTTDWIVYINE